MHGHRLGDRPRHHRADPRRDHASTARPSPRSPPNGAGGTPHAATTSARTRCPTSGKHTVCAVGINAAVRHAQLDRACRDDHARAEPARALRRRSTRAAGSTTCVVTGWAFDPDTTAPLDRRHHRRRRLRPRAAAPAVPPRRRARVPAARRRRTASRRRSPRPTASTPSASPRSTSAAAATVPGLPDRSTRCTRRARRHRSRSTALAGFGGATVTWTAPASDGGAPWTSYVVTASPGGTRVTVGGDHARPRHRARAEDRVHVRGAGRERRRASSPAATSRRGHDPGRARRRRRTPAPISTSRYIRNISGVLGGRARRHARRGRGRRRAPTRPATATWSCSTSAARTRLDGGVVLSATTRFVSYADLVTRPQRLRRRLPQRAAAERAGDHRARHEQRHGRLDAPPARPGPTSVVNPVVAYARSYAGHHHRRRQRHRARLPRHRTRQTAGVAGRLPRRDQRASSSSTARPTAARGRSTNRGCNNGWTMAGLYYLAAGAAPVRIINLPQIYNYDDGRAVEVHLADRRRDRPARGSTSAARSPSAPPARRPAAAAASPATARGRSCGTNCSRLAGLKVPSLPYSTDLRIDQLTRRAAPWRPAAALAARGWPDARRPGSRPPDRRARRRRRPTRRPPTPAPSTSSAAPTASSSTTATRPPRRRTPTPSRSARARLAGRPRGSSTTCAKLTVRVIPGGASRGAEIAALQYVNAGIARARCRGYPGRGAAARRHGDRYPAGARRHATRADSPRAPGTTAESLLRGLLDAARRRCPTASGSPSQARRRLDDRRCGRATLRRAAAAAPAGRAGRTHPPDRVRTGGQASIGRDVHRRTARRVAHAAAAGRWRSCSPGCPCAPPSRASAPRSTTCRTACTHPAAWPGFITTMPVIASPRSGRHRRGCPHRYGPHRLLVIALSVMTVGLAARAMVGSARAFSTVQRARSGRRRGEQRADAQPGQAHFPDHIGRMTAVYTTALAVGRPRRPGSPYPSATSHGTRLAARPRRRGPCSARWPCCRGCRRCAATARDACGAARVVGDGAACAAVPHGC